MSAKKWPASRRRGRRERGVTLVEVLVAIIVLALGVLGILGVQMRTLADTQTSVRRAQAIRLIEDLSERLHANPSAIDPSILANYVTKWNKETPPDEAAIAKCKAGAECSVADLAIQQINAWKQSVSDNLPSGDAMTFQVGTQLGVLVSWRENERFADEDYKQFFDSTSSTGNTASAAGITCPDNKICHLQFISAIARCLRDDPALVGPKVAAWYCPEGYTSPSQN
ncbi:MAG: type IV pilus modification protein PilV [Desulfovibrionaceae bacterium]|jgi:type IV pilus assembly protein PilV|nr:type IV pilus modification protein PilV [Desulfovibrionaceae bacterium]